MMNIPLRLVVSLLLFLLFAHAGVAGEMNYRDITFRPSTSSPLVAIRLIFDVGSQDDPVGKEGLAALTAALIAEGGTKDLPYNQILEKLYPMAASVAGECRKEVTLFAGFVHRDHLVDFESLLAKMVTEPKFAPEDFQRLRDQAIDRLSKSLRGNNDEELGKWSLQVLLYRNHPYGHVDTGTVLGLKSITLENVKDFYKQYYKQGNLAIGLGGGTDQGLLDLLEKDLSKLPKGKTEPPALPRVRAPEGLEITIVEKPADSTAILLGFPIDLTRKDDDFYALAIANSYLGEHRTFNGKLMQDLRGERGLNYGDYSYIEDFIEEPPTVFPVANNPRRDQYFSIWLRPVPRDKAPFALRAALWEYNRLVERGLTASEFERTREFLLNYSKLWVQTTPRRLGYAMEGAFWGTRNEVSELARRLPKLSLHDVNDAIHKHLTKRGFSIVVVTQDAQAFADLLGSGKPTPLTYDTQGTPGDVLAEDKLIERYPLKDMKIRIIPVAEMFEK